MGCDIHIITEIRKNGKWQWVKEIPESFDSRNYGLFSVLAGVRNSFNIKGFEAKGLPEDISAMKFDFETYTNRAKERFYDDNDGQILFVDKDGNYHEPSAVEKTHLTKEEYEALNVKQRTEVDTFDKQYNSLGYTQSGNQTPDYYVRDAYANGGRFERIPHYKYYPNIEAFLKDYYEDDWDEEMQDYGRWRVNFEYCGPHGDYHTPSFLSLHELITADLKDYYSDKYKMDVAFYEAFKRMGGTLPEGMTVQEFTPETLQDVFQSALCPVILVVWEKDEEAKKETALYCGIEEMKEIAKKYNIDDPNDIRIVFAFDN